MITGMQVRAACAMLRWSRQFLADQVGLSLRTIQRLADTDGIPPRMTAANLAAVQAVLEAGNYLGRVEFVPGGVLFHPAAPATGEG